MITKKLIEKAIESYDDLCKPECFLKEASHGLAAIGKDAHECASRGLMTGFDPIVTAYYNGMHAGYRLRQLEVEEPPNPAEVN